MRIHVGPAQDRASETAPRCSARNMGSSSSGRSCPRARECGRRCGCCRRTKSMAAGPPPARSTCWRRSGQEPTKVLGTIHYGGNGRPTRTPARSTCFPTGAPSPTSISMRSSGSPALSAGRSTSASMPESRSGGARGKTDGGKGAKPASESELNPWPAPFDQPFYLDHERGGRRPVPGQSRQDDAVSGRMLVDYVRVYEKAGGYGRPAARRREAAFSKAVSPDSASQVNENPE